MTYKNARNMQDNSLWTTQDKRNKSNKTVIVKFGEMNSPEVERPSIRSV